MKMISSLALGAALSLAALPALAQVTNTQRVERQQCRTPPPTRRVRAMD